MNAVQKWLKHLGLPIPWGHCDSDILRRVGICDRDLAWWNYNIFGNVRKELKKIIIIIK